MELNVLLVEDYPHPRDRVWRALIEPDALRVWLMANDFEPRIGKRFILRGRPLPEEWRGWVECEVLELEAPRRMVWAWISNEGAPSTRVEFQLEEIEGGTRFTFSHTGEIDPLMGSRLTEGWPGKLAELGTHLSAAV